MIQQEGHRETPAAAARGGEAKSPAKAALEKKKNNKKNWAFLLTHSHSLLHKSLNNKAGWDPTHQIRWKVLVFLTKLWNWEEGSCCMGSVWRCSQFLERDGATGGFPFLGWSDKYQWSCIASGCHTTGLSASTTPSWFWLVWSEAGTLISHWRSGCRRLGALFSLLHEPTQSLWQVGI